MRFWFVLDFCLWWQQRWCLQPRGARGCGGELSCLGGAWGYITDPSGFLQLGARYYWPEIGRFVSQDPIGEGSNWYAYVGNRPTAVIDPAGLMGYWACVDKCVDTLIGGPLVPIVTTITYWATVWVEKQVRVYVCTPGGGKWVTQIIKVPVRRLVTRAVIQWVALGTGAFAGGLTAGCVAQCAFPSYRDFWESW